jgi:hypothetical protein
MDILPFFLIPAVPFHITPGAACRYPMVPGTSPEPFRLPYLEKKLIITYVPEIQMLDLWKDI